MKAQLRVKTCFRELQNYSEYVSHLEGLQALLKLLQLSLSGPRPSLNYSLSFLELQLEDTQTVRKSIFCYIPLCLLVYSTLELLWFYWLICEFK